MRFVFILALAIPLAAQNLVDECHQHVHYGRTAQAKQCFEKLTLSTNPAVEAEGFWGLREYKQANDTFRLAVAQAPKDPNVRVRWGRLFLDRYNASEAAGLFQEALEIDPKSAESTLGLAIAASDSYESKAVELAKKAIELDPK